MTEYGLNLYWKSLFARLASLERYGVQFLLSDDAEELSIRVPKRFVKMDFFRDAIDDKPLLLEAVRLREGLCAVCGMDRARHPKREGVYQNWIPETQTVKTARCSSLGVYPMFCQSCWESRLMWRGIVEKKRSGAGQKTSKEISSEDTSQERVRRERQTVTDDVGDSGGGGVAVLSFTAD